MVRGLTDDGTGDGAPVGTITTTRTWDDSSRLTSRTDDNGNTTSYDYDALDRLITIDLADGTQRSHIHDVHDNRTITTDANGTVVTQTHDRLDRLVGRTIAPASGVLGTTTESFAYDGLSRLVLATDDDSTVHPDPRLPVERPE